MKLLPPLDMACAGEEVHLAAGAGDVAETGALGVYLAVEVDGDAAVEGDEVVHGPDDGGVVDVGYGQRDDAGVLVQPVVKRLGAGREAEHALAGEDVLALVCELAGLVEVQETVGAELGMHAEVLEVALRDDGAQRVGVPPMPSWRVAPSTKVGMCSARSGCSSGEGFLAWTVGAGPCSHSTTMVTSEMWMDSLYAP